MEQQDVVLEVLERYKKRVVATFLMVSLVVAVAAVLLFEMGGVVQVWEMEFGTSRPLSSQTVPAR